MRLILLVFSAILMGSVTAQMSSHTGVEHQVSQASTNHKANKADTREFVQYPPAMITHTLSNMRDHLIVIQKIQSYLAEENYDEAADIAESRLGMSSLSLHGARQSAQFMPKGMQQAGTMMHQNASKFARVARDAAVTEDLKSALKALSQVTAACVVCHTGYKLQ